MLEYVHKEEAWYSTCLAIGGIDARICTQRGGGEFESHNRHPLLFICYLFVPESDS